MSEAVLDSSAILAVINAEPGAARVIEVIREAAVSTVNFAEVASKLTEYGHTEAEVRSILENLSLVVVPLERELAYQAGFLKGLGRGLSLGDRVCLALAASMDLPAYTADRAWANIDTGANVVVVR